MGNIASDAVKTAKQQARQIAGQMAQEPVEIAKTAGENIVGVENSQQQENKPNEPSAEKPPTPEEKIQMENKRRNMMQALENELKEIRNKNEVKKEEEKQEEINTKKLEEQKGTEDAPLISSKPSRKIGAGIKGHLQRLTKGTEIRIPPSG